MDIHEIYQRLVEIKESMEGDNLLRLSDAYRLVSALILAIEDSLATM